MNRLPASRHLVAFLGSAGVGGLVGAFNFGGLSLLEAGEITVIGFGVAEVILQVEAAYRRRQHIPQGKPLYAWEIRPRTWLLTAVIWAIIVFAVGGAIYANGLIIFAAILIPFWVGVFGVERYVKSRRNGVPPADGPEVSR